MPEFTIRTQRGQPRRTKMVCTIGPATANPETCLRLIQAGMNVARINCSHGSGESLRQINDTVRAAAASTGRIIGTLFDLSGPKIRCREIEGGGIDLRLGDHLTFVRGDGVGTREAMTSTYDALLDDLRPGDPVFLDDGNLKLRVIRNDGQRAICEVEAGGRLTSRKGINLPGTRVSVPALTAKDREDAKTAASLGADFVALSFVREAAHVHQLRDLLKSLGSRALIISKIEKPQALDALEEIIAASDGIMVARGDLGVEMPVEQVPAIQKRIIAATRRAMKPVIVATQMLESMIQSPRPTRAEVSDIHNAIEDGCDAVMLSAETASGQFPIEAAQMMSEVCHSAERCMFELGAAPSFVAGSGGDELRRAICAGAGHIATALKAKFIVVRTETGETVRVMSQLRGPTPVVAMNPDEALLRRHTLQWGVLPVRTSRDDAVPDNIQAELRLLAREMFHQRLGMPSDQVVIIGHYPWGKQQPPNSIRCIRIGDALDD